MDCGVIEITGLDDGGIALQIAAAQAQPPRRFVKQKQPDGTWTATLVLEPCDDGADRVTVDGKQTVDDSGPGRFIAAHKADAAEVKQTYDVPMAVTLAQTALESGWGRSAPGNAFFGVKATNGQRSVEVLTHEYKNGQRVLTTAKFRAYDDFREAALDYGKLLRMNQRYAAAFQQTDPELFAQAVADAGYAGGSPDYGTTLRSIICSHGLRNLDLNSTVTFDTGFVQKVVQEAISEWEYFNPLDPNRTGGQRIHHVQTEDGWYQRVGRYWLEGVGRASVDGRQIHEFWSAAFISWIMREAGAGNRFNYSQRHSVFISQGITDAANQIDAGYWTVRLMDATPAPGDLVCWTRQQGIDFDHQNGGQYDGHSDLVVAVRDHEIIVIGGNVGSSVTQRPLPLNTSGFVLPTKQGNDQIIALMKCRIE